MMRGKRWDTSFMTVILQRRKARYFANFLISCIEELLGKRLRITAHGGTRTCWDLFNEKTILATTKHADDKTLGSGGIIERQCGTWWWLMHPRGFQLVRVLE